MITISGKQNDNEVETSIVHLMQMYTFNIEVLQKSKYFYPAGQPSLTHRWVAPMRHLQFFVLQVYNCPVVRPGKWSS